MKWVLTADDAVAIANKLVAERQTGRKGHENVIFRYNGIMIFRFGIRRGSGDKGHNFIPNQMYISQKECRTFRQCDMSLEKYIEILKAKRIIVDQDTRPG
jgi:hypothetical protein